MQGSYKGLPRPYNMKPIKNKKRSPYDNAPHNYFNSPRRKIVGYFIMLILFSCSCYWLGQSLRTQPETAYELEIDPVNKKLMANLDDVDKIAGKISDIDDEGNKVELAGNLAANSKGDVGLGLKEAPMGGIANEAPIVGNDEDLIVKGKKSLNVNRDKAVKKPIHDDILGI